MFRFIKRYQKFFMGVVAVMTICSFSFYGVYDQMMRDPMAEDPIVLHLEDGTPVRLSTREALRRMLEHEGGMDGGAGRHQIPNVLNPGFISQDVVAAGLGSVLLEQNLTKCQEEWQKISDRQMQAHFYRHPTQKSIGVKAVWDLLVPELSQLIAEETPARGEVFLQHQHALLMAVNRVPSHLVRQVLAYLEQQRGVAHDPMMDRMDFRPFGGRTLDDWYGATFVDLCVQMVLEGSHRATLQGYTVSPAEVHQEWLATLTPMTPQGMSPHALLERVIAGQGLNDRKAVEAWQHVLLFKRWMNQQLQQEVAQMPALRDALLVTLQQAAEKAHVQVRSAPFALTSAQDVWLLESYFEGISRKRERPIELPQVLLPMSQIARRAPELVVEPVQVVLRRLDCERMAAQLSLRDAIAWEVSDEGWKRLCHQVRELSAQQDLSEEARVEALELLSAEGRQQADRMARESWIQDHPEWLKVALENAPEETLQWELCRAPLAAPLPDLPSSEVVLQWLEKVPKEPIKGSRWMYQILAVSSTGETRLLTYQEARSSGALALYADRRLREEYDLLKIQGDARVYRGQTLLSFQESRDALIKQRIQPVCEGVHEALADQLSEAPGSLEQLAPYRLAAALMSSPEDPFLAMQFSPKSREEEILRERDPQHIAFQLAEGEWSLPMLVQGEVQRIQVLERAQPEVSLRVDHASVQPLLLETRQKLVQQLLHHPIAAS